jgi:hypothetical protein
MPTMSPDWRTDEKNYFLGLLRMFTEEELLMMVTLVRTI